MQSQQLLKASCLLRPRDKAACLFFIFQNRYDKNRHGQYNHEFFICTHKRSSFPQDRERIAARLPGCPVKHIILSWCRHLKFCSMQFLQLIKSYLCSLLINESLIIVSYLLNVKIEELKIKVVTSHNISYVHRLYGPINSL